MGIKLRRDHRRKCNGPRATTHRTAEPLTRTDLADLHQRTGATALASLRPRRAPSPFRLVPYARRGQGPARYFR